MGEVSGSAAADWRGEVARLCRQASALAADGGRAQALTSYLQAWDLLPEPKEAWDASTSILAAVGDLLREGGDLSNALDVLLRVSGRTAGAAVGERGFGEGSPLP